MCLSTLCVQLTKYRVKRQTTDLVPYLDEPDRIVWAKRNRSRHSRNGVLGYGTGSRNPPDLSTALREPESAVWAGCEAIWDRPPVLWRYGVCGDGTR